MDLVVDNVAGDELTVEVEEDNTKKEPLKVIVVDDVVVIVSCKDGTDIDWLITTPLEEAY